MIIDFRIHPPIPESYVEVPELEQYGRLYNKNTGKKDFNFQEGWPTLLAEMDQAGVTRAVIMAEDFSGTLGKKVPNKLVAAGVAAYPDRFFGLASMDPHQGRKAAEELEHAALDLGMVGLGRHLLHNWPTSY